MTELTGFFRGKRVFVTGHTGFKGAWLAFWLAQMGAEVTGFALAPEKDSPNLYALLGLGGLCHSVMGDVNDVGAVSAALAQSRAEIVFHMAAQALVRESYAQPVQTFATNVMGCVHVLEAVRHVETVRSVVNVTSDKCYRNVAGHAPFTEGDALGGHDPYAASKAAGEMVTEAYRQSFLRGRGVHVASARAGNVIGGGDFARDRILPDLYFAAATGMAAEIRHPSATRPWQHVLDALWGYMLLARALHDEGDRFAKAYNFGPEGEGCTVLALAEQFLAVLGRGEYVLGAQGALHEAAGLRLDAGLARRELGWAPHYDTAEAVTRTAAWYRGYMASPGSVTAMVLAQINDYRGKA
jgi:CDP-glucose 4,6-dehydratase